MIEVEGIEIINEKLKESLDSDDLEAFDDAYIELYNKIWNRMFIVKREIFEGLEFSDIERVKFYIYASTRMKSHNTPNFNSLRLEEIPVIFSDYINSNQDTFYNILKENIDIQKLFSLWFKEHGFIEENDPKELYSKIFDLEEFRNVFLSDSEIVASRFSNNHEFFELIPNDYAYLIALYEVDRDRTGEITKRLYDMKFSDKLSEIDRLELMKTHIQIASEPNLFGIGIVDRMMEFEYCLKQITEDVNYFEVLKDISTKTGLDLKTVMKFASKYDSTPLFERIHNSDRVSEDITNKIELLSKEKKIKDESILDRIDEISTDELKQVEKVDNKFIKSNLRGGPQSRTRDKFLENGYNREILSITSDGEVRELEVPISRNHEDGVKEIYKNSVVFPKDCTTVIDRSTYAAKEISSITLTIEMEMCFLVMPKELTEEQISSVTIILEKANDKGLVGIISYDSDKDKADILFDGQCISPSKTIELLTETKTQKQVL